jgi:Cdc6-like AAA superfamily ATPase
MTFGVALGVVLSGILGVALGLASGVTVGMKFSVPLDVKSITSSVKSITSSIVLWVFVLSLLSGGVGVVIGVILSITFALLGGASGAISNLISDVVSRVMFGGMFGVMFGIAFGVSILRPESWFLSLPFALVAPQNGRWQLPHVTPVPLLPLFSRLTVWLQQDWVTGLYNTNQLLTYTLQFGTVAQSVTQVLAETSQEQVLFRVAQLAEAPYDWELVGAVAGFSTRERQLGTSPRPADFSHQYEKKPQKAAAAGFWYLHRKKPTKAIEVFAVVRSLPYGEEMFTLAQILATFHHAEEPTTIAALQIPAFPEKSFLRPVTWEMIVSLRRVVEDVQVVQRSVSRSARAFALNRALGELTDILDRADTLPQSERGLIVDIAQTWQKALERIAKEVGKTSITKPVSNPYVVGDPVEGNLFVGREDVLRQLEELWVMGHQLQSVVLYGHRRMGKTSILRNVANCSGSGVKVAYINLLNMGATSQGVGEVLMAITDAISDAVSCTPPTDADLLNLPYRTFERYLKQVEAHLSGGLIIALDEFEKIEELIEAEKIPKDFMGYLRGLVQMSSKVAFAFAGLHTLEEMTADYFQPFFASVIPIHVGFLQPGATRQILANPDEEFPLDYTPEALEQIYALTAGQPYLVQLVGFQLVRRYNDYVFEQGRPRDPVFTVEDVEAVINDPEFFKRGRYYFDGVWGQAARGASGQQAILKALAPHPEGLSIDELRTQFNEILRAHVGAPLPEETLHEALTTLTRHDVIKEREGCWQIIVELFRRWVLQS